MLPPLYAQPAANDIEERRVRKLAAARHAPAIWLERARIITLSWDGAQVGLLPQGCRKGHEQPKRWREIVRTWCDKVSATAAAGANRKSYRQIRQ